MLTGMLIAAVHRSVKMSLHCPAGAIRLLSKALLSAVIFVWASVRAARAASPTTLIASSSLAVGTPYCCWSQQTYLQASRALEATQPFKGLVERIQQQGPAVCVPDHGCIGHTGLILWQAQGMPLMHLHSTAEAQDPAVEVMRFQWRLSAAAGYCAGQTVPLCCLMQEQGRLAGCAAGDRDGDEEPVKIIAAVSARTPL